MNLLVTLYTDHYQSGDQSGESKQNGFMNITWSPYDTITFKTADTFHDLCFGKSNKENTEHKAEEQCDDELREADKTKGAWIGVRQCIHLIGVDYSGESEWSLVGDCDGIDSYFTVKKDNNKRYNFYCIYLARFSETIHRLVEKGMLFEKDMIRNRLYEQLDDVSKGNDIEFKCFRSLGSEDFAVIFLADSMRSIIHITEKLNMSAIKLPKIGSEIDGSEIDLFSTVSVFPGFNNPNYEDVNDVEIIVRLNPRKSNTDNLIVSLETHLSENCTIKKIFSRKAAMLITIPKNEISFKLFGNKDGIFNRSSVFYRENFFSSRTYFSDSENENRISDFTVDISKCDLSLLQNHNENEERKNPTNDSNIELVKEFIVGEYSRMIKNSRFYQWRNILIAQKNAVNDFAEYYNKNDKFAESRLLRYMQSALHLINQACSPAAEVPNHTSYYAGSFYGLLKAYYGIIKMLFDISFKLPHGKSTRSFAITFSICLNPSAQIRSELFTNNTSSRFVVFFLPYDSFWDYSKNIKKLVHEVFHYVPPYDRELRAEHLVNIMYFEVLELLLKRIVENIETPNKTMSLKYMRFWAEFLEDRFLDKKRGELSELLHKQFPGVFIDANPEWLNRFLISGKKIYDVLLLIQNFAEQEIYSCYDDAMKYIADKCELDRIKFQEKFEKQKIKKLLLADKSSDTKISVFAKRSEHLLNTTISDKILDYITASKEAFCDLWAIKIIGCSIPEYIVFLFEMLRKSYNKDIILRALNSNYTIGHKIEIPSFKYRVSLLMHMQIKSCDTRNTPGTIFKELGSDEYLSICLKQMVDAYNSMYPLLGYAYDELFEMAFGYVDLSFKKVLESEMSGYIDKLRKIFESDMKMPDCIKDIDYLGNYIGLYKLHKPEPLNSQSDLNRVGRITVGSYQYAATSVGNLVTVIDEINANVLTGNKNRVLWFRGVCNVKFSLLPSIFREGSKELSVYANQSNMMKNAYFRASHVSWLWNLPIEQRMACLQHYGVPTNLLDFSLDPLTATHFALNPDNPEDKKKVDDGTYQPVIYVFDPTAFSIAVKRLKEGKYIDDPSNLSSVIFDIDNNEEEKDKYFVSDMSFDFLMEHTRIYNMSYVPDPRVDPYPAPIAIQQSNPRIIVQNGFFVAYSLHTRPCAGENRYEYLDLLTIQERYCEFLKSLSLEAERFIYPIYLRKEYIPQIQRHLNQLVISKGKFYPELNNILKDAMSDKL